MDMNFAELSAQRYSLRKFSDRPVEDALLQQVLEAGRNAPTAHNNQPQRIFVLPLGYPAEGAHPARLHTERKPMEQLVKYL